MEAKALRLIAPHSMGKQRHPTEFRRNIFPNVADIAAPPTATTTARHKTPLNANKYKYFHSQLFIGFAKISRCCSCGGSRNNPKRMKIRIRVPAVQLGLLQCSIQCKHEVQLWCGSKWLGVRGTETEVHVRPTGADPKGGGAAGRDPSV